MASEIMLPKTYHLKAFKSLALRWWFLAPVLLLQCLPPYASGGYRLAEWSTVNAYILTHPIKGAFTSIFPIFQIAPLLLMALILIAGNRVRMIFSAYVALTYAAIAFLQTLSVSRRYGFAVCTANLLTFLTLAGIWSWETVFPRNDFSLKPVARSHWMILLALIPFWAPVDPLTLLPDFNPVYILTSGAGLSFCLVTPLFLSFLALFFPRLNQPIFVLTACVGIILGLGNMALEFLIEPRYWWIGVLHIPLFVISLYAVQLSSKYILKQIEIMTIRSTAPD
jgi:hypothetical protein